MTPDETHGEGATRARNGISRREFLTGAAAAGAAAALGAPTAAAAARPRPPGSRPPRPPAGEPDLVLWRGKIHTMDGARDDPWTVASAVTMKCGRIQEVHRGPWRPPARFRRARVIDLRGRTVVPGIVDNHNHIVLMGLRPGYHTPLENAYSIADVQETYVARRPGVPKGEFITTIGGFHTNHFRERRLPNLSELDEAVADRPVFTMVGFSGPSTTNSRGKAFFQANGVLVGEDGSIAVGAPSQTALWALRRSQTLEDQKRSSVDAMAYATGLGVTTHFDQGGWAATHTPADGAAHFDEYGAYDAVLALHEEGRVKIRLRINFLHQDVDPTVPKLTARLLNVFPRFGDDLMKTVGIGEFTAGPAPAYGMAQGPAWVEGTRRVAEAGWRNENHSILPADYVDIITGWETVNRLHPISGLRWTLAHVPAITEEWIDRLKAMDCAVNLSSFPYFGSSGGPPYRMIVDNGIKVGLDSDGMQIAPMNPWVHAYYATTGKNALGNVINGGQQITRKEVLRLYTSENGWFTFEEDRLGSIEPGKLGDLVVLNRDYFAVPAEQLKHLRSVLTVVGGRIVHDEGVLQSR